MKEIQHPPHAPALLESMRSIGYSLEAALADIIDNSISASARNINIAFRPDDPAYIAIIDDGGGMTRDTLLNAMRHGSTNPLQQRAANDLGRYGLGLKTASLSQCRRMTVISLHAGTTAGFCWDLDVVVEKASWTMLELSTEELAEIPHVDMLARQGGGTIVLWQNLDRLAAGESSLAKALGHQMDLAREHLSLVFHRYINPEAGRSRVTIALNNNPLQAIDPFLLSHKATQLLDDDDFLVEGCKIVVKPYILPHISKLNPEDIARAGGKEGLRNQQGFYIYRNRRLIIGGTWFRLTKKDELGKLARVRVDIPNTLDHLWTLDIKKSSAHPPEAVRMNLKRIIAKIHGASKRTLLFRGRPQATGDLVPGWQEIQDREGVRFDVNRQHPSIKGLAERLSGADLAAFNAALDVIEASFPAEALYARMAEDIRHNPHLESEEELRAIALSLITGLQNNSPIRKNIISGLAKIEPFNRHREATENLIRELSENE